MRRRALLLGAFAATPATAQRQAGSKPQPLPAEKLPAAEPPPRGAGGPGSLSDTTVAPVPNRDLEAPKAPLGSDRARLGPGVINRDMPGRGQASEGSPSLLEEKLFKPVPGARLNVPFSY